MTPFSFKNIDTSDATVHVAISDGDNEIAVLSYDGREYARPRMIAFCNYGDDLICDETFGSLKEAVARAAQFLNDEYEGAN